ncbi:hypothetical protein C1645_875311 [Glomus cerebriforme]|uniref:F-box domain-containing protein n=1 Tax=Glomus cerebriforme TaxID=658196 RepID=A0A397T5M9_9GLOM|nr:hypothetical protein C1645_875311 [Glomus cerebriforme]
MSKLNGDILYLVFKELQDSKPTLRSCLTVSKSWCKVIIPTFWRNPWKILKDEKAIILLCVIISHLSDESKNNLSQQLESYQHNFLMYLYQKPLFNYITFCKHLNLNEIEKLIKRCLSKESEISLIKKEIFNLFINENTQFTHLYVPCQFNYPIHLIPEAKNCFSNLEFFSCNTSINDDILTGLTEMCQSIRDLELYIEKNIDIYGIVKLIETIKELNSIRILIGYLKSGTSFCEILENSLIQHSKTIQYFTITKQPVTKVLSSFVKLKELKLDLSNLIKNTNGNGYLTIVKIDNVIYDEIDNKMIIQTIYQNCPKLEYLKLVHLFSILIKSSPTSLFKLKITSRKAPSLNSLRYFFGRWKGRKPMILKSNHWDWHGPSNYIDLLEKYKAEGIIKKYKMKEVRLF